MLKLKLNQGLVRFKNVPMLKKSIRANMNYPIFHRMATGEWNTRTLETLARFLFANGFTAEVLKDAKFTDIFTVEESNDGKPMRKFQMNQRVKTPTGEGTMVGYITGGDDYYRVIVKLDGNRETVPEAEDYVVCHYKEEDLEPVGDQNE